MGFSEFGSITLWGHVWTYPYVLCIDGAMSNRISQTMRQFEYWIAVCCSISFYYYDFGFDFHIKWQQQRHAHNAPELVNSKWIHDVTDGTKHMHMLDAAENNKYLHSALIELLMAKWPKILGYFSFHFLQQMRADDSNSVATAYHSTYLHTQTVAILQWFA